MAVAKDNVLTFKGSNYFRQRLVLSTLSGKPIRIKDIRSQDDEPGLREFEVNLIRLLDKITNGSRIEVSETGTLLYYQPGLLYGGTMEHECCKLRSIGYYLDVLIALGPFCKKALNLTLKGVTNNQNDPTVDSILNGAVPVLKRFLVVDDGLELKVTKRGMAPEGGGEVIFKCPIRKQLKAIQLTDQGKVKRIRGVVYAVRVSPAISNRLVEAAKGVFLQFIPDVYIYTDHHRGDKSGKSPGFGITLVAETTTGVFYTAEAMSKPAGSGETPSVPEDVGKEAAFLLLEEIFRGGCVDSTFQSYAALFMTMAPKDISKCLMGPLSPYTIQFLRHLKDFFGHSFKLESYKKSEEEEELNTGANKVLITCLGIGFTNLSKRVG
ncbi:RNA 3'-terminal phosphate cyclase-like protein [Periplaneta americana]|uniref:RNA 3'-terminal phosphate cyclase-like protein n=1 Tax=Periplaneta americana TaxID=6978 RepID=UPI0037E7F62B